MTVERTSKWGCTIIVDDEDADLLPAVCRIKSKNVYVIVPGEGTMGRIVLSRKLSRDLLRHEKADHINLNKMDNRRSNLRLATQGQNCSNVDKKRWTKTPYKGACRHSGQLWHSRITANGQAIQLGGFETALEAHKQYCIASLIYHGEYGHFGSNSPFQGFTLADFEAPIIQLRLPLKESA